MSNRRISSAVGRGHISLLSVHGTFSAINAAATLFSAYQVAAATLLQMQ
jgi:hypothetical protein